MMKAKLVFEADYEIEGAYEGEGKYTGMLGGFNMKTSDGLIKFNVGSGFSDLQRYQMWQALLENGMDFYNGTIAAIEGNDIITSKGKDTESVFLPIFIELRADKTVADSRERVWQQLNAAKLGQGV
jgi:ATP-dependent DNA ligase